MYTEPHCQGKTHTLVFLDMVLRWQPPMYQRLTYESVVAHVITLDVFHRVLQEMSSLLITFYLVTHHIKANLRFVLYPLLCPL